MHLLFDRYRYLRDLGQGALGRVVHAHDEERDAPVAIKIVPAEALALLRAESEALIAVDHPRVVRIHEVLALSADAPEPWRMPAGAGALVEAFVAGVPLDRYVAAGGSLEDAALELCEALDALHATGLIHGDVKASNVLVGDDGACLVDFSAGGPPRLAGPISGTLSHLSPEARLGEQTADADCFALGVTLGALAHPESAVAALAARLVEPDARVRLRGAAAAGDALRAALGRPPLGGAKVSVRWRARRCLSLPFVGHESALTALEETIRARRFQRVLGDEGSGRTALVRVAVRRAPRLALAEGRALTFVDSRGKSPP
ncbi:MAG: protein kinase, partial [Myxococcota bacterium]